MFSEAKVSQMAAFLLQKRGGRMSYLKLMKLLYLADREALARSGESLSGDRHYSMKHGPMLSETYNLILDEGQSLWNTWFQAEANKEISLRQVVTEETLDELSRFDIEVLSAIWEQYGQLTRWQLVDLTHAQLPEWQDTNTSIAIDPRSQFIALGKTPEQAEALNNALIEKRAIRQALAEIC